MADYTIAQLVQAASGAGFSGSALITAVAVSLAEDTSRTLTAENINSDGSIDRGPWQINNVAHPNVTNSCAFDLTCAAQAAYTISSGGTDWSPWTTYTGGEYKQYLSQAQQAASSSSAASASSSSSGSAISLPDIGGAISNFQSGLFSIGIVGMGLILTLTGLFLWVLWSKRDSLAKVAGEATRGAAEVVPK